MVAVGEPLHDFTYWFAWSLVSSAHLPCTASTVWQLVELLQFIQQFLGWLSPVCRCRYTMHLVLALSSGAVLQHDQSLTVHHADLGTLAMGFELTWCLDAAGTSSASHVCFRA